MFKLIEYLNNSFSITEDKQYFYGWKKGSKWEEQKKNFLVDKFSVFTIFEYNNSYDNIKFVDLRNNYNEEVYNQLNLNSSTANAVAFCFHYDQIKNYNKSVIKPSRLFIYYNERDLEGTVSKDAGAEIHDGIQVMNTLGVCPETDWVYDISKFADKPDEKCYTEALNHKTILYNALDQNLDQLKACLISGFPVAFGFVVYQSFESDYVKQTGQVPMPEPGEKVLGGHAVALVGFDDKNKEFIVRNSWGSSWGDRGYFYMPYDYVLNQELSSDFWTIKKTED